MIWLVLAILANLAVLDVTVFYVLHEVWSPRFQANEEYGVRQDEAEKAYRAAVSGGFEGSFFEWEASLKAPEPKPERPNPGDGKEPLDVDPNNMPRYTSYNPVVGHPPKNCDCHDEPLTPGDQILWWPRVDVPGAVFVFCQETFEKIIT